ncbi:MAG: tol-pal system YbgF family protein [Muribaculaceae bacterium]
MAKEKANQTRTSIDELNEGLSSFEQKVENNKKVIGYAAGAILVIAALIFGYKYLYQEPRAESSKNEICKADMDLAMGQDSVALAQYKAVADKYSNANGERAALNAAIILYQNGKFEEAAKYIKEYSGEGTIVGPASQSLLGDCYVNLDKLSEALSAYDKAISLSNNNELYTPLFMAKKAVIYREQKQFDKEAEIYQTIKDKFPTFSANYNVDVDKYLARAKAEAEAK